MNIDIKNALTPKRFEDGGLDQRYLKSIKKIIDIAGKTTIERLEDFYKKSSELERKYGGSAFQLCLSLFEANLENWEHKAIKKSLTELLKELGFKPSNVTKLIGAAQFQFERKPDEYGLPIEQWNTDFCSKEGIEDSIKIFDYIKSLPVRSKYELSLCSNEIYWHQDVFDQAGFDQPILEKLTNSYSKILTTRELESLKKQYPKPKDEYWNNHQRSNHSLKESESTSSHSETYEIPVIDELFVVHKDSTDIEHETVQPTQEELVRALRVIVKQIDLDKVLIDDALKSQLEPIQNQLEMLTQLAISITQIPNIL